MTLAGRLDVGVDVEPAGTDEPHAAARNAVVTIPMVNSRFMFSQAAACATAVSIRLFVVPVDQCHCPWRHVRKLLGRITFSVVTPMEEPEWREFTLTAIHNVRSRPTLPIYTALVTVQSLDVAVEPAGCKPTRR